MTVRVIYRIAVPSPLRRSFDYLAPTAAQTTLGNGCRVRVPFGNRKVTGIVLGITTKSELPHSKLKTIDSIIDQTPLLPEALFELFVWAAHYYQHPIGDALASALPALLRKGENPPQGEFGWTLSNHGKGLPETALKNAPRQQQLLNLLQTHNSISAEQLKANGLNNTIARELEKKGLIEKTALVEAFQQPTESPLPLYPEQQQAVDAIDPARFACYLLHGATGSGKTEVYLQVIEKIIAMGQQALLLIPEISLTPQTLRRFQHRFGGSIAALHSGLTDRERALAWEQARSGRAAIIIGTRSAVFTPMARPGVIIVDEEHDGSFKQQDGYRYHARDLAVIRGQRENIPVVLGSATPSMESLHNCRQGRYHYLSITGRAGNARPPSWTTLDLKGKNLQQGLSEPLLQAIRETLQDGNQALVFLNRRGFAPTLTCHDCGWIASCNRCDARLTVHRNPDRTICHHCEYQPRFPRACPFCHSAKLALLGQGTARAEALLVSSFPDFPVLRIDRDSTRRKQAMSDMFTQVMSGRPCILVGTQMLAKGHHFPDVTLVAVVDADAGLFSPDFRAPEKMAQLIVQVAGRAGRGSKPGRVILQSYHAEHPFLQVLSNQGYHAFSEQLLDERRAATLPPFSHMAVLRAEANQPEAAEQLLKFARQTAETMHPPDHQLSYLGPLPSPMEKRRGRYRYQLCFNASARKLLNGIISRLCQTLESAPLTRKARWAVDIDPQDLT